MHARNELSTQTLEMSLPGVGTLLRLERDGWSLVQRARQATDDYPPPYRLRCELLGAFIFTQRTMIVDLNRP